MTAKSIRGRCNRPLMGPEGYRRYPWALVQAQFLFQIVNIDPAALELAIADQILL